MAIIDRRGIAVDGSSPSAADTPDVALAIKLAVRVASTANLTLAGLQTIDSVSVVAGNRVLAKNQTDATQNGIYVVSSGNWSRSVDFDASREVASGVIVMASHGTIGAQTLYQLTTADPIVLGTSNLTWVVVSGEMGPQGPQGTQGIQGTQGVQGNTGSTGPAPWSAPTAWLTATAYVTGPPASQVTNGGESYVCLIPHTSGTFATDLAASKWIKVAAKGDVGATGSTGSTGATGAQGISGTSALARVRVLSTTNVAISTALENADTLNGVTLVTGDLVLLTGQTAPAENGVYVVQASGAAVRHTDFDAYDELPGSYFSVMEGTLKADTLWQCTSNRGGTIGSTAVAISEFTSGGGSGGVPTDPQGRITLTTGTAIPTTDVAAATGFYYTPAPGLYWPRWNGTDFVMTSIAAELSQTNADTTKSPAAVLPNSVYPIFLWLDSATPRSTRGQPWQKTATITMTIASPCVVTWNAHGLREGVPIKFTTTGALPTGLTAGTVYYTKTVTTNSFNVSATVGGSAINTTGSQSGTHTAVGHDHLDVGTGSGTSELEILNGRKVNKYAITNGPAARLGTYVGDVASDASGNLNFTFGSAALGGGEAILDVYNEYNQQDYIAIVEDNNLNWTYTSNTLRNKNASATNRVSFLYGSAKNPADVLDVQNVSTSAVGHQVTIGFGMDATATDYRSIETGYASGSQFSIVAPRRYKAVKGRRYIQAVERSDGTNAATLWGSVLSSSHTVTVTL